MALLNDIKKYKGFSLLKDYLKNHILFYAFFQFLILRKDRTGLELFRNCMGKKVYDKLARKNSKMLASFSCDESEVIYEQNKTVWFLWLQGIENAPTLVQKCYKSVCENFSEYKINLLTSENFFDFAEMPDFIIAKWKKGVISNTHFSDLLRMYLLEQKGGIWIDATVFVTGKIPCSILESDFFVFQDLKPGKDGKATFISSWFMKSVRGYPIIKFTRILLEEYWKEHNWLCDYFLLHIFMCMVLRKFPKLWKQIPQYTNSTPHILFFTLFEKFNEIKFNAICSQTPIHKLSYKVIDESKIVGSVYEKIIFGENRNEK